MEEKIGDDNKPQVSIGGNKVVFEESIKKWIHAQTHKLDKS